MLILVGFEDAVERRHFDFFEQTILVYRLLEADSSEVEDVQIDLVDF